MSEATDAVTTATCDHFFVTMIRGGEPLHVRVCSFCQSPDWDDLRRQLEERGKDYLPNNPDVGKVAFRIDAWPHDPGANGQEYVSGHMPAAEVAQWLREIADRCGQYWGDPECPWAGDDGPHSLTDQTTDEGDVR